MASTEPDAGSDVASIATTAVKDGDHYVLRGNKVFITNCTTSDFLVVVAVTTPEAKRKHERLGARLSLIQKAPGMRLQNGMASFPSAAQPPERWLSMM